jgi:hypothetical protein
VGRELNANDDTQQCTTHPCTKNCGRHIDNRFSFRVCVRCSLDVLHEALERSGYYAERKQAAYDRLAKAGLLRIE